MAVKALPMSPVVPGRRFDAAVPGPRRVTIISVPMGGRRCIRYGTLLKRGLRVRSSWSRSGSSSGTPGPGVARELPFKSHFKGEAKQSFQNGDLGVQCPKSDGNGSLSDAPTIPKDDRGAPEGRGEAPGLGDGFWSLRDLQRRNTILS
jgi:hypothetical protein